MLKKGDAVPSITLKDQYEKPFDLGNLKGEKPFVIYFYPKNFTPGCTKEACEFRDKYQDFKDLGAEVIAISADSEVSHERFVNEYNLPFIFLSDTQKKARKSFGVQTSLWGLIPGRETFVFDQEGNLRMRFKSLDASQHPSKALQMLKELENEKEIH